MDLPGLVTRSRTPTQMRISTDVGVAGRAQAGRVGVLPKQLFVMRVELGDGTVRVSVAGDLDGHGAASFRGMVGVLPAGVRRLELDLARVTFLDAAGLREIVRLRRIALRDGYRLAITAMSDAARVVLGIPSLGDARSHEDVA